MSSFGRFGGNRDHAVGEFCICIKPLDGTDHARKRPLTVKSWSTVKDLKDILQSLLHVPTASQRLFFRGGELRNPRTLQDCGIYRNGQTVYLATSPQDEMGKPYSLEPFLGAGGLPRSLVRVLGQARRGLDRGFKPELTLEGTGGTYFLQDAARQKVAVFKPQDEEPFAPNNPRDAMQGGLGGGTVSMRPGIDAGESYVREVAAYILDDRHLHGVPATTLVEAKHPAFCYWDHKERVKLGSFQEFVRHDMVVEDISPSRLTPREVQKIALLDMRILNRDRNSVNILVRSRPRRTSSFSDRSRSGDPSAHHRYRSSDGNVGLSVSAPGVSNAGLSLSRPGVSSRYEGGGGLSNSGGGGGGRRSSRLLGGGTEYELIPIDHGLCLSDELVIDWCDWCWLDWRQVKQPIDPELYSYIQSFDPEATAEKLGNTLNLKEGCLKNLHIAETLLKEGASTGLTLYDIACIMRREDFDKISELENLVARANELARAAVDHQTSAALSKRVQNFSAKSIDSRNPIRSRQSHRSSKIADLDAEDNEGWLIPGALEEAAGAKRPYAHDPRESSTEASSEDLTPSIDLRASGESVDSSGGEGSEAPLRIWAPGARSMSLGASPSVGMPFSLSRESSSSDAAAAAGGSGRLSSPTRSAESDTDLISPVGFWQEKFETIDARNATRSFSGWGDSCSVEEASLEESTGAGSGGGGNNSSNRAGGTSGGNSASLRDLRRGKSDGAAGVDFGVGRKLFPSTERQRPPPVMTSSTQTLEADLETMAEGDHESPSPMGPLGGEADAVPFWASAMEPALDKLGSGRGGEERGAEEKESGGLGWRRGEAGLVVPEPLPPKSRSVTIQQVIQQCGSRAGEKSAAAGGAKKTLAAPRPATASPSLPSAGVDESKAQPEPQTLSPGVKIVRSYSYHGLGSLALYDLANRGTARYALRKRPNENSEQFKDCFFRFFRLLVRDFVKRRHRSIMKERGACAARQAAEKCSSAAAAATAVANAAIEKSGGRLGRRPPPAGSSKSKSSSPHAAVPATVLG